MSIDLTTAAPTPPPQKPHFALWNALKVIFGFYVALFLVNLLTVGSETVQTANDGLLLTALHRTFGAMFGLVDVMNTVKSIAFGGLITWLGLRWAFPNTLGSDFGGEFDSGWKSLPSTEKTKWILIAFLVIFFATVHGAKGEDQRPELPLPVSVESRDMILYYEVGGKSYFEKHLIRPEVPAWQTTPSGVTVGFGVDMGQMTNAQIYNAFNGVIPPSMVSALQSVQGLKGRAAYYNGLPKVRNVVMVSWDQATKVFERDTLPRFTKMTKDAFHLDSDQLHPSCNGALTSLVFNRGASLSGGSRLEMRQIQEDIDDEKYSLVPSRLRAMKRLWNPVTLQGLILRREAEASMFAKGLKQS
jgi:hypothetical protein